MIIVTLLALLAPWIAKGGNFMEACNATREEGMEFISKEPAWAVFERDLEAGSAPFVVFGGIITLLVLSIPVVAELCWWRASDHLSHIRLLLQALWLSAIFEELMMVKAWCFCPTSARALYEHTALRMACRTWSWLAVIWSMKVVCAHLEVLQNTWRKPLGVCWVRAACGLYIVDLICGMAIYAYHRVRHSRLPMIAEVAGPLLGAGCSFTIMFSLIRGYGLSAAYARTAVQGCAPRDRKAAEAVVTMAKWVVFEGCFCYMALVSKTMMLIGKVFNTSDEVLMTSMETTQFFMLLAAARFVALISGLLISTEEVFKADWMPCSQASVNDLGGPTGEEAWDRKVQELASRSVSLRALLSFHSSLGRDRMMNFDPEVHTTADVVRCAILPASMDIQTSSGRALVLDMGKPAVPQVFVTHTWSALWSDLVGAIVADALDFPEYQQVLFRLDAYEMPALLSELYWKGKLEQTYWICALSVNQHGSICRALGCDCLAPQASSWTPPLRQDGLSIPCEMNKFDDLMRCVASASKTFRQLVAVDRELRLFHRAWCIAELHTAGLLQIPHSMCLHSKDSISKCQKDLRDLKVEHMQASVEEDKVMILNKIHDKDAFNAEVQKLIYDEGGLFESWQAGMEMVKALGLLARSGLERQQSWCETSSSGSSDDDDSTDS